MNVVIIIIFEADTHTPHSHPKQFFVEWRNLRTFGCENIAKYGEMNMKCKNPLPTSYVQNLFHVHEIEKHMCCGCIDLCRCVLENYFAYA